MNNLDTLIENGLVVTENEIGHLNIGIKDGKIAYLGDENLNAEFKINADKNSCLSIQLFTPGGIRSRSTAGDCRYFVGKSKGLLQF